MVAAAPEGPLLPAPISTAGTYTIQVSLFLGSLFPFYGAFFRGAGTCLVIRFKLRAIPPFRRIILN